MLLSLYLPSRVCALIGVVGTVAGDGAPRSLSDVRSSRVCWTRPFSFSDSSPSLLAAVVSPCAALFLNFLGLAVLADASTAFAIVSHQLILFEHNWHYSPPVRSLANSHSCQIIAACPYHATPVNRSLVMHALGGAINRSVPGTKSVVGL